MRTKGSRFSKGSPSPCLRLSRMAERGWLTPWISFPHLAVTVGFDLPDLRAGLQDGKWKRCDGGRMMWPLAHTGWHGAVLLLLPATKASGVLGWWRTWDDLLTKLIKEERGIFRARTRNCTTSAIQLQKAFFTFLLGGGIVFPILYIGTKVFMKLNKESIPFWVWISSLLIQYITKKLP